jgi:hypothetical protein
MGDLNWDRYTYIKIHSAYWSFDALELTRVVLKRQHIPIDSEDVEKMFGTSEALLKLLDHTMVCLSVCLSVCLYCHLC